VSEGPFQWTVFRAALDPVLGSEQAGSRPVLVVSSEVLNEALPIVVVLPLTSAKPGRRVYATEVLLPAGSAGLPANSIVLGHQVRTIAKQRLQAAYGRLDDPALRRAVKAAMAIVLDMEG
jgi:mRNA interferase MazF